MLYAIMRIILFILVFFISFPQLANDENTFVGDIITISPPIKFEVIDLEYIEDKGYWDDRVIVKYSITNVDDEQLIKAANHELIIKDLLGNKLMDFNLKKDLYIKIGETIDFEVSGSSIWVSSERIKDIPYDDLVFDYLVHKVVKEDNSIWEYKNNLLK
tara:strand:+ start:308 stop:784 length:477 start_codon:yes stop_codon:yes gene_type:complete